jgi:acetyl/propionyl-CoA carboxylase alpha subunit
MVLRLRRAITDIEKVVAREPTFPILIKASAEEVEKGMRVVENEEEFEPK